MNNERFILGKNVKEFIDMLDEFLLCYPRKYFELRNRLVMDSFDLLKLVYKANYKDIHDRYPLQLEAIATINLIDFYIELSFKRKIFSEKQSLRLSKKLGSINKMLYKWIEDERSKV